MPLLPPREPSPRGAEGLFVEHAVQGRKVRKGSEGVSGVEWHGMACIGTVLWDLVRVRHTRSFFFFFSLLAFYPLPSLLFFLGAVVRALRGGRVPGVGSPLFCYTRARESRT